MSQSLVAIPMLSSTPEICRSTAGSWRKLQYLGLTLVVENVNTCVKAGDDPGNGALGGCQLLGSLLDLWDSEIIGQVAIRSRI